MKRKDIPVILSIAAGCGVVVTGFLSAVRTPKYLEKKARAENLSKLDHLKIFATSYWPALVSGGLTIGFIAGSQAINAKIITGLVGTVSYLTLNRDEIITKLDEVDPELCNSIVESANESTIQKIIKTAGPSVEETGYGDQLYFESYSGRWFRSCDRMVDQAIANIQKRFAEGEYLALNDFYEELGIAKTYFGNEHGWPNSMDYIDGNIVIERTPYRDWETGRHEPIAEEVTVLELFTFPMESWMDL